jgi:hypothetical protein
MSVTKSCFVAYPSKPVNLAYTIEEAIEKINQGQTVLMNSWKASAVGGRFIITAICEAIDNNSLFMCDLTALNHNVLFELGYAIARNKRIWIVRNPAFETSNVDYERFKLLTTVGYDPYQNSNDIQRGFYLHEPYNDLDKTIYRETIESVISRQMSPTLLYIKTNIETEASVKLSHQLFKIKDKIPVVVDDPGEVTTQTLAWYAQEVNRAYAVIVHFLSIDHVGSRFHNAKSAFISGLAYGFGRRLLMLAHEPYISPIDYRDLLKTHDTGARCVSLAQSWLDDVIHYYNQWLSQKREFEEERLAQTELQSIWIGDAVAENESDDLLYYFVPTASYYEALAAKKSIFIGRRGSGKTAILYKLANELQADKRNHVCIIKPIDYELEGILNMLKLAMSKAEQGYLIESFWKFLIYTELAKTVYEMLHAKPTYYDMSESESEFVAFVEANETIITNDFSIRLEVVVNRLQSIQKYESSKEYRIKVSELLHEIVLRNLRALLGKVLERRHKVAIIIDNLDRAWGKREDMPNLAELLFGLLNVTNSISADFAKSDHWRNAINLSLIIFLRSDIFSQIQRYTREADKIAYSVIIWEDKELLLRVLEQRFFTSSSLARPTDVWNKFFCDKVNDLYTKDFIMEMILPRPRDLIVYSQAAIASAVNRGHTKVEPDDLLAAGKRYSQQALNSLKAEECEVPIESLLYEFIGKNECIDEKDIQVAMQKCNIDETKLPLIVNLLCDLNFLGVEVEDNRFEYLFDDDQKRKYYIMAKKLADKRSDSTRRFKIHKAFHPYLEIKTSTFC